MDLPPLRPGAPVHAQIEEALATRIASGELALGARLPAERDLAASLDVSRMTVRQALSALAARGLVERGVGRGTFVAQPQVEHALGAVTGFTRQMELAGLAPEARVLNAALEPAPAEVAEGLGLAPGDPAVRIERVRLGGGLAMTLEDSWLPDAIFPGLLERDLTHSLYALMREDYDMGPVRATERLGAVLARGAQARALDVPVNAALMLVERVAYAADGTPVEFAHDHHRGDRARFVLDVATGG